jgi:hypothetical protein
MSSLYAMQRANGDWFAIDEQGRLRMPVFGSSQEAMRARALDLGMLLFRPVIFDERALKGLAPAVDDSSSYFWLADGASTNPRHGQAISSARLALLMRDPISGVSK